MSRKFLAITSFTEQQAHDYGIRMVQSWHRCWPLDHSQLVIYAEGCKEISEIVSFGVAHILTLDLHKASPDLVAFKEKHKDNQQSHGLGWEGKTHWPMQPSAAGPYCYRKDVVKFAHKSFAVIDAATRFHQDWDVLIWMDADTLTHRPVPIEFLESLLPDGACIAWLDRIGVYPEVGFYCINLKNNITSLIIKKWRQLYLEGSIFGLSEWHDGFVFQQVVESYRKAGLIKVHSLSGRGKRTNHPLANGPLGAYFDHLKGKWKKLPRSPRGAVPMQKGQGYWA